MKSTPRRASTNGVWEDLFGMVFGVYFLTAAVAVAPAHISDLLGPRGGDALLFAGYLFMSVVLLVMYRRALRARWAVAACSSAVLGSLAVQVLVYGAVVGRAGAIVALLVLGSLALITGLWAAYLARASRMHSRQPARPDPNSNP